jgi:hypothetical protein
MPGYQQRLVWQHWQRLSVPSPHYATLRSGLSTTIRQLLSNGFSMGLLLRDLVLRCGQINGGRFLKCGMFMGE